MRAHVGGARHRDEGAPLLRRLRSDAVVHPPAQQAGLHRVRRQGGPAGRLLRHRGHDVDRRDRARGPPYAMYKQKTWKRAAVLFAGPGHELRHRPGADLRHRGDLGPAEPAPAHQPHRRRNLLCRTGSQQGQAGRLRRAPARRRPPASSRATSIVKVGDTDVANFDEMVAAVRKLDRPDPVRRASATGTEFTTVVDVAQTQRYTVGHRRGADHRRRRRHRRRRVRPSVDAVQPAVGGARHVRVHRRPGRRTGQVAGEDPDQDRRAGALHRRRRTRSGDADQRRRRVASSAATPSSAGCGWRSGSSWPS